MGCFCSAFEHCCRRLGCSCKDSGAIGRMATIEKERSCTDIPCLGLFGIFVGVMVGYIWSQAFIEGDPDRLIRGVNHMGLICGKDEGVKNLPYAFWPDLSSLADPDLEAIGFRFKACTNDCNKATMDNAEGNHIILPRRIGTVAVPGGYESVVSLDRYCRPDTEVLKDYVDSAQRAASAAEDTGRVYGDLKTAIPLFGYTFPVAMLLSFAFILLMKWCVGVLVWTVIALILVCGYGCGFILYSWSKDEEDELTENEEKLRLWFGIGIMGATTVFLLMVIFARNRIKIAIEVIKSASRTFEDMPFMALFPVPVIAVFTGFFFAWIFAAIYIVSAGTTEIKDTPNDYAGKSFIAETEQCSGDATCEARYTVSETFTVIDYDETIKNAFAPHFFLLLWVVQIFVYFTFIVIAGAVADWYFTPRDEDGNKKRGTGPHELSRCAVLASCYRTARYHLGSVFYAAAIIATIQFIRACVNYMERQLNPGDKEPNQIQKVLFRVLNCMLWCLECCLDKVNRNALVWVSVYGEAFCPSVCGSFKLIWTNLFRVAVISFFSGIVTWLGKILIPLMSTAIMALIAMNVDQFEKELSSPIVPLVIVFFIAYGVGMLFMTVYDTAIDTVFLCFLIDEKHNKNDGQMLADPDLREIVQKYEEDSKALAAKHQRKKPARSGSNSDQKGGGDKSEAQSEAQAEAQSNKASVELQI